MNYEHSRFVDEACEKLGVQPHEVMSKTKSARHLHLVRARKAIAWALRQRADEPSYPEIGRALRREHTTIMYSVQAFERELDAGSQWALAAAALLGRREAPMPGLESALDSLRRCQAAYTADAIEMPAEAVG